MVEVIIAGSRDFNDYDYLEKSCHKIFYVLAKEYNILTNNIKKDISNMKIVSGTARGADSLGEQFAKKYNIKTKRFPADWNTHGKSAGYIRNKRMAEYAVTDESTGILIAFWDGKSKGTQHMINLARKNNLITFVVNYKTDEIEDDRMLFKVG